jgi:hypothetical protein
MRGTEREHRADLARPSCAPQIAFKLYFGRKPKLTPDQRPEALRRRSARSYAVDQSSDPFPPGSWRHEFRRGALAMIRKSSPRAVGGQRSFAFCLRRRPLPRKRTIGVRCCRRQRARVVWPDLDRT